MENETLTKIDIKSDLRLPSMYGVKYNNDNATPFDFVINTLTTIFALPEDRASSLAMDIHQNGSAVVQNELSYELAQHLVDLVTRTAVSYSYPLHSEVIPSA
jgi:ATP-dependent Clp protease adapter protein ClpS